MMNISKTFRLLNICFSQPHFKGKIWETEKHTKSPGQEKFPSHLFHKPAPDSKLKPLIMWGYFQWCCFAPVSFVKHNLGVKVTVVWGTPCNNQSFQNSTGGGQRDQTHKTLPHSLHGSSKSCFMLRCTHQLLNLLQYKVIKELESPWHKNLQEKHQLSVEWEMPRPTCPSRNEKKKKKAC